jgi:hypothetical protein
MIYVEMRTFRSSLLLSAGIGKFVYFRFISFVSSLIPQLDLWLRFDGIIHVHRRKSNIGLSISSFLDFMLVAIAGCLFDLVCEALDLPPS